MMADEASTEEKAAGRVSSVDRAYAELRVRIEINRYPPGYSALENELARELGMSRTSVREALIRLQQEGLVDVGPWRGMQVLGLSPTDMKEIYEVIAGAEAVALHILAERVPSVELAFALGEPVGRMERALEAKTSTRGLHAEDFHRALFRLCGNRRLKDVGVSHLERTRRALLHAAPAPHAGRSAPPRTIAAW